MDDTIQACFKRLLIDFHTDKKLTEANGYMTRLKNIFVIHSLSIRKL